MEADDVDRLVRAALAEDVGARDVTTEATVPADRRAAGTFLAKQDLVLAGLPVAEAAFRLVDPGVRWEPRAGEGARVARGASVARVEGQARALLTAERVALNFLQRLSGVATETRRFVDAVAGTKAQIRDTRKTTPLLRSMEKYAVGVGGGAPHRPGLDRGILVKENHIRMAGSVAEATRRAVAGAGGLLVEVEVERLDQVEEALAAGAQMLLLDNFTPQEVGVAIGAIAGRVPVEVSGGIRLGNVRVYAEAGADLIAVGALTHSAPACDISLETEPI
ncbi:MAG: carboxylating nicotinate-nucleotide diphosphorylase [Vicinamibacteria bacterium]